MYPLYLREKARKLRREKKLMIDELAECLALSRSTIYYWVRDIPVPRKTRAEWPESARLAGGRAVRRKFRLLREAAYAEGQAAFSELSTDPTFRDVVILYIAEGYKRSRNSVSLANSDPAVIQVAARWIRRLSDNPVDYGIQYHADQDPAELRAFWGAHLCVDPDAIRLQRKSNSNQLSGRNWRSRHGVLTVRSSDTYLRSKLQAWMDCLRQHWIDSD